MSRTELEDIGADVVSITSIAISVGVCTVALVHSALAIASSEVVVREHALLLLVTLTLLGGLVAVVIAKTVCNRVLRHASGMRATRSLERLLAATGVVVARSEE